MTTEPAGLATNADVTKASPAGSVVMMPSVRVG